jgi:hypothetical protein
MIYIGRETLLGGGPEELMLHRLEASGFASRLKARLFVVSAGNVCLPGPPSLDVQRLPVTSRLVI